MCYWVLLAPRAVPVAISWVKCNFKKIFMDKILMKPPIIDYFINYSKICLFFKIHIKSVIIVSSFICVIY